MRGRRSSRDARGRATETRSFDEAGHLLAPRDGSAIERATYDARSLRTSLSHFGADERPASNANGVAVERSKFDCLRNEVERSYFGTDGKPIASSEGFATHRWEYDPDGDLVLESFLDATGAPVIVDGNYATRRITRDGRGLVVAEDYFDVHGERILTKDGYAAVRYERDRNGDVVVESYLGKRDEPIRAAGCTCARKKLRVRLHRRLIMTVLLDPEGLPSSNGEQWSVERATYDERGLKVRVDHFDGSGAPVVATSGAASVVTTYDARGNVVAEALLGTDGRGVAGRDGFARRSGRTTTAMAIAEAHFGPDGAPVVGATGVVPAKAALRRRGQPPRGSVPGRGTSAGRPAR